jgi:hypothetical protein
MRLLPAALFTVLFLALAGAQDGKAVNTWCPVKGKKFPVKANLTVAYEGQVVGFC